MEGSVEDATLADITVLDLTCSNAAGYAGRLLADFGAQVIIVKTPGRMGRGHLADGDGYGPFAAYLDLGKKSVALDVATPFGRQIFERLAGKADVILRGPSCCAGEVNAYAVDELRAIAPSAVITTVTPTSPDDAPLAPGTEELMLAARSGWASINQVQGREPLMPSGFQSAFQGGLVAFTATVAELYSRGKGSPVNAIDVSILEVLVATLSPALLSYQFEGASRARRGVGFPYGPVPAKDGYFVLTTSRAHFWRDAMNALGLPELAEDPRFNNPAERGELYDEVSHIVAGRIGEHEKLELFNTLGTLRVSAGAVLNVEEVTTDPHLAERAFFRKADLGLGEPATVPGPPFVAPLSGWAVRSPEHAEDVSEVLAHAGVPAAEIEQLVEAGVVR